MRIRILSVLALVFLPITVTWAQTSSDETDAAEKQWDFSFVTSGYLVPHDQSYVQPTFSADHNWLHLEARYNYEDMQTGSLWAGYNFSVGQTLTFDATPIIGAVFGNTRGVAPGYLMSLTYKRLELSSEGEFVFDLRDSNNSFFYNWNELTYSPLDWLHAGLVSQRTRVYHTPLDVQRGFSLGVSYRRADFTTYILNAGWTDPTVVLSLGFSF